MTEDLEAPARSMDIQAVTRAAQVLALFDTKRSELTVAAVAKELGMNRTTAHRYLTSMEHAGLLVRNGNGYEAGPLVIQVGGVVLAFRIGQPLVAILGAIVAGVTSVNVVGVRQRFVELRDDQRGFSPHRHMVDVAVAAGGAALVGMILAITVSMR